MFTARYISRASNVLSCVRWSVAHLGTYELIYESGLVESIGSDFYTVKSQTNKDKEYCVDIIHNSCTCKDSELGNTCKHFIAVQHYRTEKIKQILTQTQIKAVRKVTTAVIHQGR